MITARRQGSRALAAVVAVPALLFAAAAVLAQAPAKKAGTPPAKSAAPPRFKAIWEPVNVPEDLELMSVHFVSAEVGWVSGGKDRNTGGVIYHTKDGGTTWTLQVGDPQSSDGSFDHLRFVDATHGFAVQYSPSGNYKLYSTTDGETWTLAGGVPEHRYDIWFAAARTGFIADWGRNILRSTDGGSRWQSVKKCMIKTEVAGLMRDAECFFNTVHFPTAEVGYAMGGPLPENSGNMLARTDDGGATWSAWVTLPGESSHESSLWFMDENNGVFREKSGKLFRTADGGKTWTGVMGQGQLKSRIAFADANVGWMVFYQRMTYTRNGGKSWASREIAFPTMVNASSLPARDRGYVVGDHGMVYRYRIVPFAYTAKGMIAAPAIADNE
jgi:photosystem II stability/assembly factor-like uncharacterized protein